MRLFFLSLIASAMTLSVASAADVTLLNVSYDPTRELYVDINKAFSAKYRQEFGKSVEVKQSHGGSGTQVRAVNDGLEADVVTLALAPDTNAVAQKGLLAKDWQARLTSNSAPYVSTIVFLVRKGNPKGIRDWDDLVRPGVEVVTPNPKTSGGARWNYLAAWGFGVRKYGSEQKAEEFAAELFKHVPVLDNGARGATMTFTSRAVGDVLLAWENEAHLAIAEIGPDKFDIVAPPLSILAEPTVAVVDKYVDKHGTRAVAEAYLRFLYSPEGQEIIARNYYRPRDEAVARKYAARFPSIDLLVVDRDFGGWDNAHKAHFAAGGSFDRIFTRK